MRDLNLAIALRHGIKQRKAEEIQDYTSSTTLSSLRRRPRRDESHRMHMHAKLQQPWAVTKLITTEL
jgi:hypothetical protein